MEVEKYTPSSITVGAILGLIASGDIAIPEIQRPFVWRKTQVRDLLDSLYKGFPTGYLIIWKNLFFVKHFSPFSSFHIPIVIMGNSSLSAGLVRIQIPQLRPAA